MGSCCRRSARRLSTWMSASRVACYAVCFLIPMMCNTVVHAAEGEVEDKPEQATSFCDAIEDSNQRKAIISCVESIFPSEALSVLSQCRERVFGSGTFDDVLFSFCDDDPLIQKWLQCNTRLYKEREVTFTRGHNEDVEVCFMRVFNSSRTPGGSQEEQDRLHHYQYQKN